MKKILILLSVLSLGVFASCEIQTVPEEPVQGEQVTIHVSMPATKVAMSPDGDGLHLAWQAGDCIRVISNQGGSEVFTIKEGFTDHEADFVGTAVEGTLFNILYPGTEETVEALEISYPGDQVQNGNGSTDHLKYAACLVGVNSYKDVVFTPAWAESHSGEMLRPGALKLQMTLPAAASALKQVVVNVNGITLSLGLESVDVSMSEHVLTAYAMLPFGDIDLEAVNPISVKVVTTDEAIFGTTFNLPMDKTLQAGQVSVFRITSGVTEQLFAAGSGTEGDPWLVSNTRELLNVRSAMADDVVAYFKQTADIDLGENMWIPLNADAGYRKGIYYDGQNFEIKHLKVNADHPYPSFAGVLNGTVKDVIFSDAVIEAGANVAGVLAGYLGSADASCSGSCSGVKVINAVVSGSKRCLGGLIGRANNVSGEIKECFVMDTKVTSESDRVGGLIGQLDKGFTLTLCGTEEVTVSGTINVGGLVGVCYGNAMTCWSSGSVASENPSAASGTDIGIGGLIGYLEHGDITKCSSTVNINQIGAGRDIGGFVGKMLASSISKSYCTGNVTGQHRNVGGFVGLITLSANEATITDCYCTGNVNGNAYTGGFLGLHEKGKATISNCFATGAVEGSGFAIGGMAGVIGSADFTMKNCAAWNPSVTAGSFGDANWSSGAVAAVTFPTCTMTDNYRSPDMVLTAWWVPAADYDHPNVSSSSPLVVKDKTTGDLRATTAESTANGQDNYPQFAYHGKSAVGKTLAQVCKDMGWDGDTIWYLGGVIPNLR